MTPTTEKHVITCCLSRTYVQSILAWQQDCKHQWLSWASTPNLSGDGEGEGDGEHCWHRPWQFAYVVQLMCFIIVYASSNFDLPMLSQCAM